MTTGLSDQQLQDAYNTGWLVYSDNSEALGLRAVADLAITHLEAENHGLRKQIDELTKK